MDDRAVIDRTGPPLSEAELREQAVAELRKRRELSGHVLAYVMVNAFLVVIWFLTGSGFFWPAFPMFGWGIGLMFHTWDVLWPEPNEKAVNAAMDRIAHRR
ncbi:MULTISPECIES: 2TM domain-containing protein [unclassified Kribbella]|uniref:2TM domain-containing protein n=1 Tax=unclassified Kribbella TaxID=2644121 RepID=UPI003018A639